MSSSIGHSNKVLHYLINAAAGNFRQYQVTFWSQLIFGVLYSFGYFDLHIAGIILGFIMPVLWIVLTYRFVLEKARHNFHLPFPRWMQKNPGNLLVIVADAIFLALIWIMILTGLYDATWVKVLFTVVFPILTLTMLRNMIIFPFDDKNKDFNKTENQNPNPLKQ